MSKNKQTQEADGKVSVLILTNVFKSGKIFYKGEIRQMEKEEAEKTFAIGIEAKIIEE